jgi:hypothetical protein
VHDGFHVLRGLRRGWHAEETAYNNYAEATTTHYVGNVMTHTDIPPIYNWGAKVQQIMHICKKNMRKFIFKRIFRANGLHSAAVASGECVWGNR